MDRRHLAYFVAVAEFGSSALDPLIRRDMQDLLIQLQAEDQRTVPAGPAYAGLRRRPAAGGRTRAELAPA